MSPLSTNPKRLSLQPSRRSSFSQGSEETSAKTPLIRPSTSSHESSFSGYKILEPGDFRRVRNHLVLRPATACSSSLFDSPTTSHSENSPLGSGFASWTPLGHSSVNQPVTESHSQLDVSPSKCTIDRGHDQDWGKGLLVGSAEDDPAGARSGLSICSNAGPRRSSAAFRQRPYTASSITSTARSSLSSCQDSIESDRRPLMSIKTPRRRTDSTHKRPATSGPLINCPSGEQVYFQPIARPTVSDRSKTCNTLTAEERRQQIRRAKKLAHILGEESRTTVCKDNKSIKPALHLGSAPSSRPQSVTHAENTYGLSNATIASGLQASDTSPELAHLSRKAALVLGIPHPYNAAAPMTTPSNHVCKEKTDAGQKRSSPLPTDRSAPASQSSVLVERVATLDDQQAATIKGERRRRVAKMSRWLGETIPVELIPPTASWKDSDENGLDASDVEYYTPWQDVLATHCAQIDSFSNQILAPYDDRPASNSSPLESFMSVDTSDSEDETPPPQQETRRQCVAPDVTRLANEGVLTSSAIDATAPVEAEAMQKSYCAAISSNTSPGQDVCSPFMPVDINLNDSSSKNLATCGSSTDMDGGLVRQSSTEDKLPRKSAAFLDLSDSESCTSGLYDDATYDDSNFERSFGSAQAYAPASASDRSISKLSNFFGSTPSQIVRSQSNLSSETHLPCFDPGFSDNPALLNSRTILKSLEDEVMEESRFNSVPKSEKSRKLRLMKKRTTQLFS